MSTELTQENKEYLIAQIEKYIGVRPFFYLKFCSKEKYAQDVCEGRFFANTADFFRKQEIENGERGQGDKNELLLSIRPQKISMYDIETGELIATSYCGRANIRFNEDGNIPLVSFVGIPLRDMILVKADETHAEFSLPFTDDEYNTMVKKFGAYCVILDARELEEHIAHICQNENCDYIFNAVQYCCGNRIDRMQAFANCDKRRFLYKDEDLSYQREYRLAVCKKMPDDHLISLGKMENARILSPESLKNLRFSIEYVSEVKENAK